jgi:twitching motility protein PilJ
MDELSVSDLELQSATSSATPGRSGVRRHHGQKVQVGSRRRVTTDAQGGLLANLPIGRKLVLGAVALALPLAIAVMSLMTDAWQGLSTARSALYGQQLLNPMTDALENIMFNRLSATAMLGGDSAIVTRYNQEKDNIIRLFSDIEALAAQGGLTQLAQDAARVLEAYQNLTLAVEARQLSSAEAQVSYSNFLNTRVVPMFEAIAVDAGMRDLGNPSGIGSAPLRLQEVVNLATVAYPQNIPPLGAAISGNVVILNRIGGIGGVVDEASRSEAAFKYGTLTDAYDKIMVAAERAIQNVPAARDTLLQATETFTTGVDPVLAMIAGGLVTVPNATISADDLRAQVPTFAPSLFDSMKLVNDGLLAALTRVAQFYAQTFYITLAVTAVVALLALLAFLYIARAITRPLGRLTSAAKKLATGDLSTQVDVVSADEVGQLSAVFNEAVVQLREASNRQALEIERSQALQGNIAEFLNVAMDIANGDLTKRGVVTEDVLGNVIDAINVMIEELAYLLKDVQQVAASVKTGSEAVLAVTDAVSSQVARQADEARAAQGEMAAVIRSIREMAQNAEVSAQAAGQALTASDEGQAAVGNTLSGMQNIRREVQAIAKRVKGLGDRSLEISEIVDTISAISYQTNLLALNAAIEASGAGEAGKRFAIVADEVQKLADDATKATQSIDELIKAIQTEVQEVIRNVEDGTREVELGYQVATEAGERLKEIGDISRRSAELAELISAATAAQVRGVESVGEKVAVISQVAERSQAETTQGRQAAETLRGLSRQLSESLSRFKLEGA